MSDFKNQSPWGSPPPGGNGDGGFRRGPTPPNIDEIVKKRFIDGIIILKNDEILFEQYYGNLTEDKPHLMNSISKSVVGLLAG